MDHIETAMKAEGIVQRLYGANPEMPALIDDAVQAIYDAHREATSRLTSNAAGVWEQELGRPLEETERLMLTYRCRRFIGSRLGL